MKEINRIFRAAAAIVFLFHAAGDYCALHRVRSVGPYTTTTLDRSRNKEIQSIKLNSNETPYS